MAENVEVKLGADTGNLKSSVDDASNSVAASLKRIADSLENFGAKNKAVTTAAVTHNADMARSFGTLQTTVTHSYEGIVGAVEKFRGVMVGLGAVLAGGVLWRESVGEMLHMEDEVRKLENVMGMLSDQATQTALALKIIGSSSDQYNGIALKMGRQLKGNAEEFDRLKIATKDASGNLLPMDTIMQNAFKRMQDFKAGTDQAEFALTFFGRGAAEVYDIMARLPAAQERAKELMHELGIEWGPDKQKQVATYRMEVGAFKVMMGDLEEKIAMAVLPSLMRMAEWFNTVGPRAIEVIITAVKIFLSVLTGLATAVQDVVVFVVAGFQQMQTTFVALGTVVYQIFTGQWSKIAGTVRTAYNDIVNTGRAAMDTIVANTLDGATKIANIWKDVPAGKPGPGPLPHGPESWRNKPAAGTGTDDRLAQWKDELVQMQEAQGYFNEMSKAQEAEFWTAKLALVQGGGDAEVKLRRELNRLIFEDKKAAARLELQDALATFQLEIDAAKNNKDAQIGAAVARTATLKAIYGEESAAYKKGLSEELKLRDEWVKKEQDIMKVRTKMIEDAAIGELEMHRMALDQGVALRQVSAEQSYAIEVDFENKLYALRLKALEDERAMLQEGTKERLVVDAQIEALERSHQKNITQIQNAAERERQQAAIDAANATQNAVGSLINDLISHTKTWQQSLKDAAKSLTDALNQIASQQIAKQFFGPGSEGGNFLNNIFGKIFGGGSKGAAGGVDPASVALTSSATALTTSSTMLDTASATITTAQTAAATALSASAVALSGAAAALSAAGAASAAKAGTDLLSSAANLFVGAGQSYAVGTPYVPQDSLAIVHKGEAIIPAAYNKGAFGGAFTVHNQFAISGPIDTRTQQQIMKSAAEGVRRATLRGS